LIDIYWLGNRPPNLPSGPILSGEQTSRRQPSKCSSCKNAGHNARNCPVNRERELSSSTSSNMQSTTNQPKSRKVSNAGNRQQVTQYHGDSSNDDEDNDEESHSGDLEQFVDPQASDEVEVQAQPNDIPARIWIDHDIQPIPTNVPTRDAPPKPVEISSLYPKFKGSTTKRSLLQHKRYNSPHQYMEEFWTPAIFKQFVDNTNEYAINTRIKNWTTLTTAELKSFFSIVAYLGLARFPSRDWGWYDDVGSKFCYGSMTKFRFELILKALHWEDTSKLSAEERYAKNNADPFWQVSTFTDQLSENFQKCYDCGQRIAIDEMAIGFKGHHRCKCYNDKKPCKWHFKAFCLNDSETFYLWKFYLYRGKDEERENNIPATEWPVRKLLDGGKFFHLNHVLATDNWYTSIALVVFLLLHGIYFMFLW